MTPPATSQERKSLPPVTRPPAIVHRWRDFLASMRILRTVHWPSRSELSTLTATVVLFSVAVGFGLTVVDSGLDQLLSRLLGLP